MFDIDLVSALVSVHAERGALYARGQALRWRAAISGGPLHERCACRGLVLVGAGPCRRCGGAGTVPTEGHRALREIRRAVAENLRREADLMDMVTANDLEQLDRTVWKASREAVPRTEMEAFAEWADTVLATAPRRSPGTTDRAG